MGEDEPCHKERVVQVELWGKLLFIHLSALDEERNSWNEEEMEQNNA